MNARIEKVIRNGLVVTSQSIFPADIAIGNGVIQEIGQNLGPYEQAEVIDASGQYVLPGAVDVHVHFDTRPNPVDTLEALSRSAAWGGTTTIVPFLFIKPGRNITDTVPQAIEEGDKTAYIDFSFHPCFLDTKNQFQQIPNAVKMGLTSFKMVMTYARDGQMTADDTLLTAMELIAENRGLAMVHCENGVVIDLLQARAREQGRVGADDWVATQPNALETEAINRAIAIASLPGCPLYIPHISTGAALGPVERAKANGQTVYAETLASYLLLTHEEVRKRGDIAKVGPPLRGDADRESLWSAIHQGTIDVVATDHVAKDKKGSKNILNAPFGAPGAETLLTVMYDEGVNHGKLTLCRLVQLLSENPSKLFGLYPKKGTLQVSSDADLVVWDPRREQTITANGQHTNAAYTLYEGRDCIGAPVLSLQRGKTVFANGELNAQPGQGCFLPRKSGT
ncbi:dihydropyrimidinase [Gammaproteobacteria bacterium]|nr:dihydropyrimidinase [Gammaproteobacteria bacterium]